MELKKLGKGLMPRVPKLKNILGPSFVLLGLGLGSGELILWPYLAANWGLGIIWGALLGITFQFFINMEVERYTLVCGESVFVGMARKFKSAAPVWFILSTLLPWMWPGIILSAGAVMVNIFGGEARWIAIGLLAAIGAILSLGSVVYKTEEKIQKGLIFVRVPVIVGLAVWLAGGQDWQSLGAGLLGRGEGYNWLPTGLPIISFLAAFAYSGAGGNLNLAQSFYIKEKGYGMGKYGSKITSLLKGESKDGVLEGKSFELNKENLRKFRGWWKLINIEHGLVFWLTGLVTILMLALLSFATVHGSGEELKGLSFLFEEAKIIGLRTAPVLGVVFLVICGLMLFSTQLSVMDATSRIMAENLVIWNKNRFKVNKMNKFYYGFLWTQIGLGVLIIMLNFKEPLFLVTLGAALNAVAMLVYSAIMLWMNSTSLPKQLRPGWVRVGVMFLIIYFFGVFSCLTLRSM